MLRHGECSPGACQQMPRKRLTIISNKAPRGIIIRARHLPKIFSIRLHGLILSRPGKEGILRITITDPVSGYTHLYLKAVRSDCFFYFPIILLVYLTANRLHHGTERYSIPAKKEFYFFLIEGRRSRIIALRPVDRPHSFPVSKPAYLLCTGCNRHYC